MSDKFTLQSIDGCQLMQQREQTGLPNVKMANLSNGNESSCKHNGQMGKS
jgi:hypothetical protein